MRDGKQNAKATDVSGDLNVNAVRRQFTTLAGSSAHLNDCILVIAKIFQSVGELLPLRVASPVRLYRHNGR